MSRLSIIGLLVVSGAVYGQQLTWSQLRAVKEASTNPVPQVAQFLIDNGLRVLLVEDHALPEISFTLRAIGSEKDGGASCGALIGKVLRQGTQARRKEDIDNELQALDATLNFYGTSVSGSSFSDNKARLLEVAADLFINPRLDERALTDAKNEFAAEAAASLSSTAAGEEVNVWKLKTLLLYGRDRSDALGLLTPEAANQLTLDQCKAYYRKYFNPQLFTLMVTGDVSLERLRNLVEEYFGGWRQSEEAAAPESLTQDAMNPLPLEKTKVVLVPKQDGKQSWIHLTYPVELKANTSEDIVAQAMNLIFGGGGRSRLSVLLHREKKLAHGAYSALNVSDNGGTFEIVARASNELTAKVVASLLEEMRRMIDRNVTPEELRWAKAYLTDSFKERMGTSRTLIYTARNIDQYKALQTYYADYLKNLAAITPDDIQAAARKYLRPDKLIVLVVGDRGLATNLRHFSPDRSVAFYDIDGNEDRGLAFAPDFPRIGNELFKRISVNWSEEGGVFPSNNWVTNERGFLGVLDDIERHDVKGGVYIGLAANQNYSYIARIKPDIAFFVDIRLQNRMQHYVYKMIFEEAPTRAEFLSLLLSRPLDPKRKLASTATVTELVDYFFAIPADHAMRDRTKERIVESLKNRFQITLSEEERKGIDRVVDAFARYGVNISYSPGAGSITYGDIMVSKDDQGNLADFMNSHEDYTFLRQLQLENRIIPLTGNLGGKKAIRKLGDFMRRQNLALTAYFVSNAEDYLLQDKELWRGWIENLKTLPVTDRSVIIRCRWYGEDSAKQNTRLQSVKTFLKLDSKDAFWDSRDLTFSPYLP